MDNKFKTVSIKADDYKDYEELRDKVSSDIGMDLSMAQFLKIAITFYKQRRTFDAKASKR